MTIDEFILDCIHYTSTDLCKYEGLYLSKSQIEQIAEWLEELKMLRLQNHLGRDEALIAGRKEGYNKAIDDFRSKLIMHFADWELSQAPCNDDETDMTREIICETIENAIGGVDEIAEQLKAGGGNE